MSSNQTPTGFSIESFLTRIIPGLIVISPILLNIWVFDPNIIPTTNVDFLVIALVALIFGELIEQVRSGLFRVPKPFSHYLYTETGDDRFLPRTLRYSARIDNLLQKVVPWGISEDHQLSDRLDFDFLAEMIKTFKLNPNLATSRDFYDALILHLGDDVNVRTKDYRNAYIFSKNLKLSTFIALLFYLYYAWLKHPSEVYLIFIGIGFILVVFVTVFLSFLQATPDLYMEMLEKEFYIDRIVE